MNTAITVPRSLLNKVPEVTLSFWIIKIMSTTVGETGADFLAVANEVFLKFANGAVPKKVIVVPGRLVNLVV